jgi:hypothetical protein
VPRYTANTAEESHLGDRAAPLYAPAGSFLYREKHNKASFTLSFHHVCVESRGPVHISPSSRHGARQWSACPAYGIDSLIILS